MTSIYSPVKPIMGNTWQVGKIDDHVARPLSDEEVEVVCNLLNDAAIARDKAALDAVVDQYHRTVGESVINLAFVGRLASRLRQARAAIDKAISDEDGLDGGEGEDLLTLIDDDLRRIDKREDGRHTKAALAVIDAARHVSDAVAEFGDTDLTCCAEWFTALDNALAALDGETR